jgi:integrase
MAQTGNWKLSNHKNLNEGEITKLFKVAFKDGVRTYIMFVLAYNGALSVSELIHVRIEDFDFKNWRLSILPVKKAGRRRIKLNGKIRMVDRKLPEPIDYPMPMTVMVMIQEYIVAGELPKEGYLFPGRTKKSCKVVKLKCKGGHISKREVQGIFAKIAEMAKITKKGRGIHSLKHARLSEVGEKTRDPYIVKQIGRHESISMGFAYIQGGTDRITTDQGTQLKKIVDQLGGLTL